MPTQDRDNGKGLPSQGTRSIATKILLHFPSLSQDFENLDKVISYLRNSFKISKNNFNFLSLRILLNSSKYSRVHFSKFYVIIY